MNTQEKKQTICMIVPETKVMGGIAAVTASYRGSRLEDYANIIYVESYCDGSRLKKLIKALRAYCRFFFMLLFKHIDLVHIHSSFGPSFYRKMPFILMANCKHIPVVNHIHGAEFGDFFENATIKKRELIKKIYNKCELLIALSAEWKDNLSQIVPEEKITVIPNYSILHEEAVNYRKHCDSDNVSVLFLGELGKRKGVYDIPRIVKKVIDSLDSEKKEKVSFILCGAGSEVDEENIKSEVKNLGLSSIISFPGWVRGDDKDRLLRQADIFFLPSYNEGMPMSILDACGYGLAQVVSDVGGIPQVVKESISGFLRHPGDIDGFSDALVRLIADKVLRTQLGDASYEYVKANYSIDKHIELLEMAWERCLAK